VPLVTRLAGSAVFVIPQGVNTIEDSHVLFLSGMADMMLHRLLGYEATVHPEWKDWKSAYELFRQMDTLSSHDNWLTELEAFTGSLWHALMGPIHDRLAQLGVSQVLILPQGGLQLLPLHAAWCEEGGKRRYFSDDFVVSYAPSAYALHACCRRATERCGRSALVVGVDEYTKLKPLLSATAEAKAIAGIFGATPLLNSSATDRAVIEHAAHSAYVHLSCHGHFISEGNPLDSALYLGGDTQLSLSDIISRLDLGAARLAVLSACETGIVESSDAPDECIGLSAGFIEAGAPAVISTLWIVDDRSTRLLLEQFYQNHFNHGMTLPLALKEAQKWLRDRVGDENYAHPYYWAAFTLTGV
jgi:CHAT domain-containing protein